MEQVSQIKTLLDELAKVVAEMEAMSETPVEEGVDAEPMTDEQEASLRSLEAKADKLKERISFCERIAAKELELRSVLERAAPAKKVAPESKETAVENREYAVPKNHGNLRAFKDAETAYRAGMHLKGYVFGDAEARRWCQDHGVESRAQAGGINSLGGVLTSPEMSGEIVRLVEEFGSFPANARRVNMNSDTLVIARRTGGLAARPVGENAEVTQSDVTFDNIELTAKIWGVLNRVPNSLLEDSIIDLADAMSVEIAQAYAEAYDNAGWSGDSSNSVHGIEGVSTKILRSPYSKSVVTAPSGDNVFSELELKSFTDLISRLPLFARRNAKFYVSPAGYGASMLRLMVVSSGNNVADIAGGAGLQFLGFPVVLVHSLTSDLTSTGGKVACLFGDLAQAATFGERRAISIKTATERYLEYDQTAFFAAARNAIVVHDLGSTTVAGPIVALKFAA